MEGRCNILTCISVIYSLFVCMKTESLTSIAGYTFEILILQCLFVLLFAHNGKNLKDPSKYRPHVDPNLMCLFLFPLCLMNDISTVGSEGDSSTRFEDIQLSLGVTAVSITKYFFILDKNRITAIAVLSATTGYLLVFASLSTILLFILSSLLIWKSIDWIPKVVPQSFSFAEMCICLQLGLWFSARIIRGLSQMPPVQQDELRLKWIGSTAVIAILAATMVIWMMKAFLSVLSLQSFLGVYTMFSVFCQGFLTWVSQENPIWWFWQMIEGNCTLITLLVSWLLFGGITVIWTVGHTLQMSILERKKKQLDNPELVLKRQDRNEYKFEAYRRKKNIEINEVDNVEQTSFASKREGTNTVSFHTRKVFHIFILLVYVPGLFVAPQMLFLASCLAFGVFIIVEAARVLEVPGIGSNLDSILRTFVDERDSGILFLTHFYLLVGLSLPLWITNSSLSTVSPLKLYSGVLSLGIGDTVACVAGRAFGRFRWNGTKKTVEGTASSIFAQLGFIYICTYYDLLPSYSHVSVLVGVVHSALYEAFTDQIDNLVLPLALYPFLCLS